MFNIKGYYCIVYLIDSQPIKFKYINNFFKFNQFLNRYYHTWYSFSVYNYNGIFLQSFNRGDYVPKLL